MSSSSNLTRFHIHGDNIVECERTLHLIRNALKTEINAVSGPVGSPTCPVYTLTFHNRPQIYTFTFFPGYNRWDQNILSLVQQGGGGLREAADTLLTKVTDDREIALIAIEYCGALPAGNQAWQRNGRAYAFAKANIPYLYITEIGGVELGADRKPKAARFPNPAVPFSYLSLSLTLNRLALPVFVPGAGASLSNLAYYKDIFGTEDLARFLRHLLLNESVESDIKELERKTLRLSQKIADAKKANTTLTSAQWEAAYTSLKQKDSLIEFLLRNPPFAWAKIAYIATLTPTARRIMSLGASHAIGLTSSQLPLCLLSSDERLKFAQALLPVHADLPADFLRWLERPAPLTICWVMGFKPQGEDARPDRGLPPFARMLIGEQEDLLTFVYGPAPAMHWSLLHKAPLQLMRQNGLWEAILTASDAVLIDSATAGSDTPKGFMGSHWANPVSLASAAPIVVTPCPTQFGENDVDTAIHLLVSSLGGEQVFEGLCNPPGGDWSGISLLTPDRSKEMRWLTLPRVTAPDSKRPDHVFQVSGLSAKPILLIIESKERAQGVENNIGSRLARYVTALMAYPASAQREHSAAAWDLKPLPLNVAAYECVSVAAFSLQNIAELKSVAVRAAADLTLGFEFGKDGNSCQMHGFASNSSGQMILKWLSALNGKAINLTVVEHQ